MIPESVTHLIAAAASVTLVRGTLVFLAAVAVSALVKKLSGEIRHLVWLGVVASFLLIPLAWLALPSIDLGIPRAQAANLGLAAAPALSRVEYARLLERTSVAAVLTLRPGAVSGDWIPAAFLAAWFAGVLVLGGRLVVGTARLRRLARRGSPDPNLQSFAERVAADLSLRGKFCVILSASCRIPFSFGLRKPVVILPVDAPGWPLVRLGSVLAHELAHLRRRDLFTQSVAYAVCVLLWFIPPLWLAYRAMLREAETCCDQQVIDRGVRGPEYANSILDLVKSSGGRVLLPCTSAALGLKTMIRSRITRLLALRPGRHPFRLRDAAKVALVCLCCLAPVLAVFGQAQSQALPRGDPLFGTWVNLEYDRGDRFYCAKVIIEPDGRERDYRHITDTRPACECWNTVESTWVDAAGQHWYQSRLVSTTGSFYGFVLGRVSSDGGTFETVFAQYGYPQDIDPLGSCYEVAYRQE